MKKHTLSKAKGQSFILIAVIMAALILIVGLAVDAGNAYAAQRKAQSTANAAAIAGTKRLAMARDNPQSYVDRDIEAEIKAVVVQNGFSADEVIAEYLDASGNVLGLVGYKRDEPPPKEAVYIRVRVGTHVQTYFVRIAGYNQVGVSATTQAQNKAVGTPGCTDGIYPIGVFGQKQAFERGKVYWIWDGDPNVPEYPGNLGWLRWRQDPDLGSAPELAAALTPPGTYGDPEKGYFDGETHILGQGHVMYGNTGLSGSSQVQDRLDYFISSGEPMILPLWSEGRGQGVDTTYVNNGFAAFRLTGYCFNQHDCAEQEAPEYIPNDAKALRVTFLGYSLSGCSVSIPVPPADSGGEQSYATAGGMVYMCSYQAVLLPPDEGSHLPVDIVHLVDSSGSMGSPLVGGGGKSKIQIEKEALVYFNNLMSPQLGDRLGAVKFRNYNQDVQVLSNLTWDISYLNSRIQSMSADGWTPWAKAVLVGTATLYGSGRNPDNKPVLIIASDGAPTTDLDNETDGDYQNLDWAAMSPGTLRYCYLKDSCSSYPGCVQPSGGCPSTRKHDPGVEVLIDALDAADVVKGRKSINDTWWVLRHGGSCGSGCPYFGVQAHLDMEVFVISIKGQAEFCASVLKYVASAPSSEHYFEIYKEADAKDIYRYIANAISGQLPYCYIDSQHSLFGGSVPFYVVAGGAVYGSGTSSGDASYSIPNVPVDPYVIYTITGTTTYQGTSYGAASGCDNPGQIGLQMPLPQNYQADVYLVPPNNAQCPDGTIEIPPP